MKKCLLALCALLVVALAQPAKAMSEGVTVTNQTQAEFDLHYTLTAERVSDNAVLVHMEIPRQGKLKELLSAALEIGAGNGSPDLHADLMVREGAHGARELTFQLNPALARKGSIMLTVPDARAFLSSTSFFSVELSGYITQRASTQRRPAGHGPGGGITASSGGRRFRGRGPA